MRATRTNTVAVALLGLVGSTTGCMGGVEDVGVSEENLGLVLHESATTRSSPQPSHRLRCSEGARCPWRAHRRRAARGARPVTDGTATVLAA